MTLVSMVMVRGPPPPDLPPRSFGLDHHFEGAALAVAEGLHRLGERAQRETVGDELAQPERPLWTKRRTSGRQFGATREPTTSISSRTNRRSGSGASSGERPPMTTRPPFFTIPTACWIAGRCRRTRSRRPARCSLWPRRWRRERRPSYSRGSRSRARPRCRGGGPFPPR